MVQVEPSIKGHIDFDALFGDKPENPNAPMKVGKLNDTQFQGYTGGPAEAKERYLKAKDPSALHSGRSASVQEERRQSGHQGQLFNPESIPPQEAHHQTPDQFARDPRTWWHGRVTKGGPKSSLGGSTVGRGEGFHAGTYGAAEQRLKTNIGRGVKPGYAGRMYPLRITGPVDPPEEPQPDVAKHVQLGPRRQMSWGGEYVGGRRTGYLYKNEIEGGGAMSVGVPKRKGFLSTQREMVTTAKKGGKYVHPSIDWAVRGHPEHTPEEVGRHRYASQTPEGHRYAQGFLPGDPGGQAPAERMERTSYQTQAGGTQQVYRYRDPTPGSALLSKQWDRGSYTPPHWTPEHDEAIKKVAQLITGP